MLKLKSLYSSSSCLFVHFHAILVNKICINELKIRFKVIKDSLGGF
jgi:hypothetical protein